MHACQSDEKKTNARAINLPADAELIIGELAAHGFDAYAVGGCVRDMLLGTEPKDWDITTSAEPHDVKRIFKRSIDTGIKHGTVTVLIGRRPYEVTTFRIDGEYKDGRRPSEVKFSTDIKEDLARRDFTMNAIAYKKDTGFVDPFGGVNDIRARIIRCVGDASRRFNEDALRMLRLFRFAAQLNFKIDIETYSAAKKNAGKLTDISAERIREELTKLLHSGHTEILPQLSDAGLWLYEPDLYAAAKMLPNCKKNTAMLYAVLTADGGEQAAKKFMRGLCFDNKTLNETAQYVKYLHAPVPAGRYELKKMLQNIPPPYFQNLIELKNIFYRDAQSVSEAEHALATCGEIVQNNECYLLRDLAIDGSDLIGLGYPPGKKVGETLRTLLEAVIKNPCANDRESLIKLLQ
ncbi:MAG: CCA tRNA nucleotidyltransferase [Defluviitaleaceae bacterium]|nr:CCA tRNA nucleotidyltransferase [Defluviitaleaceae bacterium]